MDPNANLREQAELLDELETTPHPCSDDADRLRELRVALREWIARGGFAPTVDDYSHAWERFQRWCQAMAQRELERSYGWI